MQLMVELKKVLFLYGNLQLSMILVISNKSYSVKLKLQMQSLQRVITKLPINNVTTKFFLKKTFGGNSSVFRDVKSLLALASCGLCSLSEQEAEQSEDPRKERDKKQRLTSIETRRLGAIQCAVPLSLGGYVGELPPTAVPFLHLGRSRPKQNNHLKKVIRKRFD